MAESGSEPEAAPAIPTEKTKTPWGKIAAVVIVIVLIVAAVAAWQLLGAREATIRVVSVDAAGGTVRNINEALSLSTRVEGPVSEFKWEFGDEDDSTVATNASSHSYTAKGIYLVLLTIRSPGGQVATNDPIGLLQLTIEDPSPAIGNNTAVAVAIASPNAANVNTDVTLDGNSSYGFAWNQDNFDRQRQPYWNPDQEKINRWNWSFGDGSAAVVGNGSAQRTPVHRFTAAGLYAAKLTVLSQGGDTDETYVTVRARTSGGAAAIKNPNTLVIASIGDPQYLDPAIDYETAGGEVIKNVYDRLITREVTYSDPANPQVNNSKIVGMLAQSWTRSTDGQLWNFTLRQNVRFHDGSVLTPEDVEYSIERVLIINRGPAWILDQSFTGYASDDPGTGINERWEAINDSVVVTGPRNVEFRLAVPYGAFLQTLDFEVASIVSEAWVAAHGGTVWGQRNTYVSRNMMGTGPYKLDHWTPGVELKLVKNADYWGTPKPRIDTILYKQILDPVTQELLLKNGDVDWAEGIPQTDIDLVETFAGVVVKKNPSLVIQYLGLALDNSWEGDPTRSANTSPFADLYVRRAVSLAIDYTYLHDTILEGLGYQMKSPVPDGIPGYDGSFWHYGDGSMTQRRAWALENLSLAADPALRDGFATDIWYNTGNPTRDLIAVMVQANLQAIGITVNIRAVSWPELLTATDYREAPMFILGWAPDYLDPDDYLFPLFHSSACPSYITGTGNPGDSTEGTASACYADAEVDAWIEQAATSQDPAERMLLYRDIQQKIVEDAPWVFLYQPVALDPIRTWLKGYYFDPMELKDFQPLYKEA